MTNAIFFGKSDSRTRHVRLEEGKTSLTMPRRGLLFYIHLAVLTVWASAHTGFGASATVGGITYTYAVSSGMATISRVTVGSVTEVSIPSILNGCPVTALGESAFEGCSGLTSVTIPSSVTSIGDYAFSACSGLTSMTIPSSVTSIGVRAFQNCSGLTSVMIPSSVTSIGVRAFAWCGGLTSFVVDAVNQNYSSLNGLLCSKDGRTLVAGVNGNVTIPSGVTSIEDYAFSGRSGLTSVTIPSSVTSIGDAVFNGCSGLELVTIPSSVTSIGRGAFSYCSELTSFVVDVANPNYSSLNGLLCSKDGQTLVAGVNGNVTIPLGVRSIWDEAFHGCSGLTSVTIPSGVTSIGVCAFDGCSGLTSVTIPPGVTSIGDEAFLGCSGLTSVKIPSSVESIGFVAFSCCSRLTSFVVDVANPNYSSPNGLLCSKDGQDLITGVNGNVTIPPGVTSIEDHAFSGRSGLTSVKIPSSVTSIGMGAFCGCEGLETVYVSAGDVEGVKEMIVDSDSDIDVDSLTFVEMLADGGPYTETVDGVEWTFMVEDGMARVGGGEGGAAISRETLGAIVIPSTLGGYSVVSVSDHAFEGCKGLTFVTISDGVEVIGESAFENCRHLETITIPATVKKIDAYAFYGCGRLKTVNYLGEKPVIEGAAFVGTGVEQSSSADVVNVVVSNVIVQYVFNSVQPEFAIPATSDTGFVNIITEVKGDNVAIPATWAEEYPNFVSKYGSDFTKALTMKTGKKDGAGNEMLVWQDYVAGTDPTNEKDVFAASITIVDGKVTISYTPELDDARKAMRKYTIWGKKSLLDTSWTKVPEGDEAKYNFFKVSVEMR